MFVVACEGYQPDLFTAHVSSFWFGAYWLVPGALLVYLFPIRRSSVADPAAGSPLDPALGRAVVRADGPYHPRSVCDIMQPWRRPHDGWNSVAGPLVNGLGLSTLITVLPTPWRTPGGSHVSKRRSAV